MLIVTSIVATGAGLRVAAYFIEGRARIAAVAAVLSVAVPVGVFLGSCSRRRSRLWGRNYGSRKRRYPNQLKDQKERGGSPCVSDSSPGALRHLQRNGIAETREIGSQDAKPIFGSHCFSTIFRAGDRTRTGDVQLGKLAFYQLNYARDTRAIIANIRPGTSGRGIRRAVTSLRALSARADKAMDEVPKIRFAASG